VKDWAGLVGEDRVGRHSFALFIFFLSAWTVSPFPYRPALQRHLLGADYIDDELKDFFPLYRHGDNNNTERDRQKEAQGFLVSTAGHCVIFGEERDGATTKRATRTS
jgi:hypothetical protein